MFQEALADILARLETARDRGLLRDYALIGGFAVSAWGVPRATRDFDFAVAIGSVDPQALATFLGGRYERGDDDDPLRGVIHASLEIGSDVISLQLIMLPPAWTEVTFRHVESILIMDRAVPVVSWEVLVLLKVYAGGPHDQLDARQILEVRRPRPGALQRIAEIAESVGILEEWTAFLSLYQKGR